MEISNRMASVACIGVCAMMLALTGCKTSSERTAGTYFDDRMTTHKVASALKDAPIYKFADVKVNTFRGTVQLSGFVNTEEQRKEAVEIARRVEGVQEVINNISLKPLPTGREPGPAPVRGPGQEPKS
jgi:osmotically-inducible protein OsmY